MIKILEPRRLAIAAITVASIAYIALFLLVVYKKQGTPPLALLGLGLLPNLIEFAWVKLKSTKTFHIMAIIVISLVVTSTIYGYCDQIIYDPRRRILLLIIPIAHLLVLLFGFIFTGLGVIYSALYRNATAQKSPSTGGVVKEVAPNSPPSAGSNDEGKSSQTPESKPSSGPKTGQ